MIRILGLVGAIALIAMLPVVPAQAQRVLGGVGAPQAVNCANSGGTMNGAMCSLPDGRSCDAMALARSDNNSCIGADGQEIPKPEADEEDFGTNDGSDHSGDSGDGGDSDGGGD